VHFVGLFLSSLLKMHGPKKNLITILEEFAKLQFANIYFVFVFLIAKNSDSTRRIVMKFNLRIFLGNMWRKINFLWNSTCKSSILWKGL